VWVATKAVFTRAIPERFRDELLMTKRYVYFTLLYLQTLHQSKPRPGMQVLIPDAACN